MNKTKFDIYFEITESLHSRLMALNFKGLEQVTDTCKNSITQMRQWIDANSFPARKSEIAAGLEEGVNEIPFFFEALEEPQRSEAFSAYFETLNSIIPNYFEKQAHRIRTIVSRDRIKNESEFYLLRAKLDEIEGNESDYEIKLQGLLDKFEADEL